MAVFTLHRQLVEPQHAAAVGSPAKHFRSMANDSIFNRQISWREVGSIGRSMLRPYGARWIRHVLLDHQLEPVRP
ncbi:MAG: hypothetical protein QNJ45_18275 [Ardenticatenaceae bacterium]|nr:hypothetical protein [Ardenticatenaceae bacterium]